jgi:uncharacterized protein
MDAALISRRLTALRAQLAPLHIKSLSLFGSVARGDASEASDLDFLVEFEGLATFDRYMDLKELLEAEFETAVDLVTVRALKPLLRDQIVNEAIGVA